MSVPKIAINGFGRIGRIVTRIAKMRRHFDVVAINDLSDPEHLAYLFKYDSVHGMYPGDVRIDGNRMIIDDDPFQVLSEKDPTKLPWRELGVDYVIESTGKFLKLAELEHHLEAGAKRVIVTVPTNDYLESTVVLGVSDYVVTKDTRIISNASCTTNCAAPVAMVLHRAFSIKRGVGRVIPELQGKLDGLAMRVPVPDGSVVDLTVELVTPVTVHTVNEATREAAEGPLQGILQYQEDPIVSSDVVGNTHSSIFDPALTQVIDETFVKVIAWYDNEWGYSARVEDLIERLTVLDGMSIC